MERYFTDEQYQKRMHEKGYTQTDMEQFDRIAVERRNCVATPEERRYCRDQYSVVQQSNQGGGSNTVKPKEHLEHKELEQRKKETVTDDSEIPNAEKWSSWPS